MHICVGTEGSPASSGNGSGLRGLGEFRGVLSSQTAGNCGEVAGCGGGAMYQDN